MWVGGSVLISGARFRFLRGCSWIGFTDASSTICSLLLPFVFVFAFEIEFRFGSDHMATTNHLKAQLAPAGVAKFHLTPTISNQPLGLCTVFPAVLARSTIPSIWLLVSTRTVIYSNPSGWSSQPFGNPIKAFVNVRWPCCTVTPNVSNNCRNEKVLEAILCDGRV